MNVSITRPRHLSRIRRSETDVVQENIPLFYSQLHGVLPRSDIEVFHLNPNEYIVLPEWHQTAYSCYIGSVTQILQQARTLQHVIKRLAQVFPKSEGSSEFRFQIFDYSTPLPNIYLSTDLEEAKGQLINLGLPLSRPISLGVQLGMDRFRISDIIHILRERFPNGWMLVLFICTSLNVLDAPLKSQQLQRIKRQQTYYSKNFSGYPLDEYLPHLQLKKQEPKIIQESIRFVQDEPEPTMRSISIPNGERIIVEYKGRNCNFDVIFLDARGKFRGSTDLFIDGQFIKKFKAKNPKVVETLPIDLPSFRPYQFLFRPVSVYKNGNLNAFHLTFNEIQPLFNISRLYLRDKPWSIVGKDKFIEACRRTSKDISIYKIEFVTPFSFSFLILKENKNPKKTLIVTQEKKIFSLENISLKKKRIYATDEVFFLHDIMTSPYSDNITIGISPVAVFINYIKQKSQRIRQRPSQIQGSLLPIEGQDWLFGRTNPTPDEEKRDLKRMLERQEKQEDQHYHRIISMFRR